MSDMISASGAVREVNEIAATDFSDAPAPAAPALGDPAMMPDPVDIASFEFLDGEDPEIAPEDEKQEDLDALRVSLSSSLEQLKSVRKELLDAGHINRSEAAMLKNLTTSAESINSFFERMPVSSFTEMDSKVNYNATCESLGKSIVDTVIAIIKTIYKYIISIGKWFISFVMGRKRKDSQFDQADKAVEKKQQQIDTALGKSTAQEDWAKGVRERVDAMLPKVKPMYSRLVELMVNQPATGAGDPLCRADLKAFVNLSVSTETLRQVQEADTKNHQLVLNVSGEQAYFINHYNTMSKVASQLTNLPLRDLCNYPGLLRVLKEFRSYIAGLERKPSHDDLDEVGLQAIRKFTQQNPHGKCNDLLIDVDQVLKGNEATLKAIEANVEKSKGFAFLNDDFFPSRQRAAAQVQEKQLVLQEIVQIQNILAGARDRCSQMNLEYARARGH